MGAEFKKKTRESYAKHVDRNRAALAEHDLLTVLPEESERRLVATISPEFSVVLGERLLVDAQCDGLAVSRGNTRVGTIETAPSKILSAVRASGGVAAGEVAKINELSGTCEIKVK